MSKVVVRSIGNYYQFNLRFNTYFSMTIYQLYTYMNTYKLVTRTEYLQILTNAWNADPQHYTETDFRNWVVSGYITITEFESITGLTY